MISKEDALYQSCYCEENVYKLIENSDERDNLYAIFISNKRKLIPLWRQKAARNADSFVAWDYHVILIEKSDSASKVYDLDSTLEWGIDFEVYWEETMNMEKMEEYSDEVRRMFRAIPGNLYISLLSSDRSHMKNADGSWMRPPPNWPIINPQLASNLLKIMDFSENFDETLIMDEKEMHNFFKSSCA